MSDDPEAKLVTVGRFSTTLEAQFAQRRLEEHEIPSVIFGTEDITSYNDVIPPATPIRLQVNACQAESAFDILETTVNRSRVTHGPAGEEAEICLACEAPLATDSETCAQCGWTYAIATEESETGHTAINGDWEEPHRNAQNAREQNVSARPRFDRGQHDDDWRDDPDWGRTPAAIDDWYHQKEEKGTLETLRYWMRIGIGGYLLFSLLYLIVWMINHI